MRTQLLPGARSKNKSGAKREAESKLSIDLSFDDDIEDISIRTDGDGIDAQGDVNKIDKAFKKYQK